MVDALRASLLVPSMLGQRAVDGLAPFVSFDAMRGRRSDTSLHAEVSSLRDEVRALALEVDRLHGELAELRPVRHTVVN